MKVVFYQKNSGRKPVEEFLLKLPSDERAKVAGCLASIEKMGFESPRVKFRQIKGALWEIKISTSRTGYRLFYVCLNSQNIVLLHSYKKQSQKAPKKEIEIAETRMTEVIKNECFYIK